VEEQLTRDQEAGQGESPPQAEAPGPSTAWYDQPRVRLAAVVLVVIAAVAIVWAISRSTGSNSSPSSTTGPLVVRPIAPVALNARGLRQLASLVGQPIYWAGPRSGYLYELRRTSSGDVYVRYLPSGVKAGAGGANYLTVATYPYQGAYDALKRVAGGGKLIQLPGGGIALGSTSYPKSVHVAFQNVDFQVEVYDPSPARALQIASSGRVQPVR